MRFKILLIIYYLIQKILVDEVLYVYVRDVKIKFFLI
jgi:hypothetical protein